MAESDAYAYYAEMARCELFSRHRSCSDGSETLADNMKKQCIIASSSIERETVNLSNGERERNGSAQVATEQKQKP